MTDEAKRVEELERALRFYADLATWDLSPNHYNPNDRDERPFIDTDRGRVARAALSDTREQAETPGRPAIGHGGEDGWDSYGGTDGESDERRRP